MFDEFVSFVVLAVSVLCGIGVLAAVHSVRAKRRACRALGAQLLQAFRMLIKHLQVHRGITAAHLGGETNLVERLKSEAHNITNDIASIVRLDPLLTEHEDWHGITKHWAKLSLTRYGSDPYDTYQQHCKLIAACLAMMRHIAFHYRINESHGSNERIYWYELLFLGEKLGQLRALGTMRLTLTQRLKVKQKSTERVTKTLKEIDAMFQNKRLQEKIGPAYCDEINNFIAMVEHYIIAGDAWMSTKSYFDRSTETIDLIYKCFDEEMQLLLRSV